MGEREDLVDAFVAWSDEAGLEGGPNRIKVAKALLALADGEALSEAHVDALAKQYRQRMYAPRDIIAARDVAEQMCRWWSERAPPAAAPISDDGDIGGLPEDFAFSDALVAEDPLDEEDAIAIPQRLGGEPEPGDQAEDERGLIPEEFKKGVSKQDGVDIESLPSGHGFRPAVVASVKPTSSIPPASTSSSLPPSSLPPEAPGSEPPVSRHPSSVPPDSEHASSSSKAVMLGAVLVVVVIAAIAVTQLL